MTAASPPAAAVADRAGTTKGEHFALLDGCRALAALAVLVTHVSFITGANVRHPLGAELARLDVGVSVFFVLSGFLLYRPFAAARLAGQDPPRTVAYLWRRVLRIFPAYWLALTATVLLTSADVPDVESGVLWYSLTHVWSADHVLGPLLQSWTLATELAFYAFLPCWALAIRRLRLGGRGELAALAGLWLTGVAFQAAIRAFDDLDGVHGTWLPAWFDHFALGMGLAVLHASGHRWGKRLASIPAGGWWLGALAAFLTSSRLLGVDRATIAWPGWQDFALHLLYAATAFCVLVPAIFGDRRAGVPRRVLAHPAVAWVGVVSYGVYLWHELWLAKWRAWRDLPDFGGSFLTTMVVVAVTSIATASVSWLLVEKPILALKRLVPDRRRA